LHFASIISIKELLRINFAEDLDKSDVKINSLTVPSYLNVKHRIFYKSAALQTQTTALSKLVKQHYRKNKQYCKMMTSY